MSGCFPNSNFDEWTLCGKCLMKVPVTGEHLCEIIQQLKFKFNSALLDLHNKYEKRIDKLESAHLNQLNPSAFLILTKRCEDLEELIFEVKQNTPQLEHDIIFIKGQIKEIIDSLNELQEFKHTLIHGKKPYKCPVCDCGKNYTGRSTTPHAGQTVNVQCDSKGFYEICNACEGKGSVWG